MIEDEDDIFYSETMEKIKKEFNSEIAHSRLDDNILLYNLCNNVTLIELIKHFIPNIKEILIDPKLDYIKVKRENGDYEIINENETHIITKIYTKKYNKDKEIYELLDEKKAFGELINNDTDDKTIIDELLVLFVQWYISSVLNCKNVCKIHEFGLQMVENPESKKWEIKNTYAILEYNGFTSLSEILEPDSELFPNLSLEKWISIINEIKEGIECLQKHHFVHLDLNLENIGLDEDGNVRICHFEHIEYIGNADYKQDELPDDKPTIFTDPFYSKKWPDKNNNHYFHKYSDMYSFGIIVYFLFLFLKTKFYISNQYKWEEFIEKLIYPVLLDELNGLSKDSVPLTIKVQDSIEKTVEVIQKYRINLDIKFLLNTTKPLSIINPNLLNSSNDNNIIKPPSPPKSTTTASMETPSPIITTKSTSPKSITTTPPITITSPKSPPPITTSNIPASTYKSSSSQTSPITSTSTSKQEISISPPPQPQQNNKSHNKNNKQKALNNNKTQKQKINVIDPRLKQIKINQDRAKKEKEDKENERNRLQQIEKEIAKKREADEEKNREKEKKNREKEKNFVVLNLNSKHINAVSLKKGGKRNRRKTFRYNIRHNKRKTYRHAKPRHYTMKKKQKRRSVRKNPRSKNNTRKTISKSRASTRKNY